MKYKGDPYQVEYAAILDVDVCREGMWNWNEHDKDMLEEMALTYDPSVLRAKVIKDHEYYGPAFGHVLGLHIEDDATPEGSFHLIAKVGFLESGKSMVESGEYNERSIGYAFFHPTPGLPYLWEFSLLGANTPAVTGLKPIIFEENEIPQLMQQLAIDRVNEGMSEDALARQLSWERDDDFIYQHIRNKSRFKDKSIRTVGIDEEAGILAKVGKLKPEYVGEGNKDAMVAQTVMFVRDKGWTLGKAKTWVGERQLAQMTVVINSVVPYQDLSLADEELEWDNEAAENRRREWAGGEDNTNWDKYRTAYLWYDSEDKEVFGGYKLPIGDIVDGNLKAVPRGIFAAAGAVGGARGGVDIPDADLAGVKTHLEKYYAKMERKAPWQDSISIPLEGVENINSESNTGGKTAMTDVSKDATDEVKTPENMLVVEAGATADLSKQANEARLEKERQERDAQVRLTKEIAELKSQAANSRYESIQSQVRTMQAEGYVTTEQVEMGLADALAATPDIQILVGDKQMFPRDIFLNALRVGGRVKLKHEISKDILEGNVDDPLAKARAKGIDTTNAEKVKKLMDGGMTESKAIDKVYREVKR